jgi:organic hydroperoxide reductase OsmC/OhrA
LAVSKAAGLLENCCWRRLQVVSPLLCRSIASSAQFDYTDLEVDASATLLKMESGYNFSEIVIRPTLKIGDDAERGHALDLLKKAHRLCLVSRAFAIPMRFEPQLEVAAALSSVP